MGDIDDNSRVTVRIEVPRWGHRKIGSDGQLEFISPLPCPVNYGSVNGSVSADGEPLDAVVLGPALDVGTVVTVQVRGVVHFRDAGLPDPKLICSDRPLTRAQCRLLRAFFAVYAQAKRIVQRLRGAKGETRFEGLERGTGEVAL